MSATLDTGELQNMVPLAGLLGLRTVDATPEPPGRFGGNCATDAAPAFVRRHDRTIHRRAVELDRSFKRLTRQVRAGGG